MRRALITAPVALLVLPSLCRRRFCAVVVSAAVLSHPSLSTGCAQLTAEGTFSDFGTYCFSLLCFLAAFWVLHLWTPKGV